MITLLEFLHCVASQLLLFRRDDPSAWCLEKMPEMLRSRRWEDLRAFGGRASASLGGVDEGCEVFLERWIDRGGLVGEPPLVFRAWPGAESLECAAGCSSGISGWVRGKSGCGKVPLKPRKGRLICDMVLRCVCRCAMCGRKMGRKIRARGADLRVELGAVQRRRRARESGLLCARVGASTVDCEINVHTARCPAPVKWHAFAISR